MPFSSDYNGYIPRVTPNLQFTLAPQMRITVYALLLCKYSNMVLCQIVKL